MTRPPPSPKTVASVWSVLLGIVLIAVALAALDYTTVRADIITTPPLSIAPVAGIESPCAADTTTSFTGAWPVARGGTGATTAAAARTSLAVCESPLALDTSSSITGALPVAKGGTGASTAPTARTALGIAESATKTVNATGTPGQIAYDASYLYYCTATDTWARIAWTAW